MGGEGVCHGYFSNSRSDIVNGITKKGKGLINNQGQDQIALGVKPLNVLDSDDYPPVISTLCNNSDFFILAFEKDNSVIENINAV